MEAQANAVKSAAAFFAGEMEPASPAYAGAVDRPLRVNNSALPLTAACSFSPKGGRRRGWGGRAASLSLGHAPSPRPSPRLAAVGGRGRSPLKSLNYFT